MNTDDSNSLHTWIEPEIEARLTALVLGEASDFERDELERLVAERPELGLYQKRLEAMHRMLREVTAGESAEGQEEWKLAPERREVVLARLGGMAAREANVAVMSTPGRRSALMSRLAAAAAIVAISGLVLALMFSSAPGILRNTKRASQGYDFAYHDTAGNANDADPFFREAAQSRTLPLPNGTESSTPGGAAGGVDSDSDFRRLQRSQHEWQSRPVSPSPRADLIFEAEGSALADPAMRPPVSMTAAPEAPAGPMVANPSDQPGSLNGTVALAAGGDILIHDDSKSPVNLAATPATDQTGGISVGGGSDGRAVAGRPLDRNRNSSASDMPTPNEGVAFGDALAITNPAPAAATRGTAVRTDGETGLAAVADAREERKAQTRLGVPLAEAERLKSLESLAEMRDADAPTDALSADIRELAEKEIPTAKVPESAGPSQLAQIEIEGRQPTRDQVVRRELSLSDETPPASEKLQRYGGFDNGMGVEDKIPYVKDIPILGSLVPGQAGAAASPAAPAAKPIRLSADPVSGPVVASEPVAEEPLEKMREGNLAQNRESEAEVAEFDGFIQFGHGGRGPVNAPASGVKRNETGAGHTSGPESVFGSGGMIDLSGKVSQESDFSRRDLTPLDPLTRSEAKQKKDASRLERLSEVDKSVQDILALTPILDQPTDANGIQWDHLQASTGAGGAMRSSGGVISGTIELNAKLAEPTAAGRVAEKSPQASTEAVGGLRSGDAPISAETIDEMIRKASDESNRADEPKEVTQNFSMAGILVDPQIEQARTHFSALRLPTPAALDETSPVAEPFSTFSLHVSDVSFQLAKAALASGQWPEAEKIRIEEFVNAFDYGDPMPGMGERVACRIDQAAHPFLQQRNLVRIALRTAEAGRSAGTPLRLTLLLDSSGSMERPDRRETVRRAVATLAGLLGENDRITLVSFARQPRLVADAVPGNEAMKLAETVAALPSEGGTNLEAALRLAFEKARELQETHAQNRIVLLTDGAANLGDAKAESLASQVETMRESGIAFDAAGFGAEGLNDEILEALTRKGDGRYYLLDRPEDAEDAFAKQIAGALRPAAKNVKVQVEFHPDRVKSYKLLGFEKHRLATEDFRNDAVDAAELAAAEAGVAVYQVEPDPAGEGDLGSVSVRFRDLDGGEMVERRWALPHLVTAPAADQGGEAIRIATVASQFAAKLAGGPLGDVVDLGELAGLAASLPDSPRVAELRTMIEQARAIEGTR